MSEEQVAEFVDLIDHNDYEILNQYPFTIRKKSNKYVVSEFIKDGYPCIALNRKTYLKHVIVSRQFIPNPDPKHLTDIDHISRDRTDYHLSNLRFVSRSTNLKNKSSYKGVNYTYVDVIPDESIVVDFYDTRNGRHEFENYYYHEGVFYYDNEINYRILHINVVKSGSRFVSMKDINGRQVSVMVNRFLQQHDLI